MLEESNGKRLGITACSKSKRGGENSTINQLQAQHLYDSWLFDSRVDALKANCDGWIIFSGKHGCLEPTDMVEWYDQVLSDHPKEKQRELANDVATYAAEWGADEVLILMGRDYATPLEEALDDDIGILDPLEGVGLFDQRKELKQLAGHKTSHDNESEKENQSTISDTFGENL